MSSARSAPTIKVVGVGGGGSSSVSRMVDARLRGVEFIACNTDAQALQACDADVKIGIGHNLTKGLGAGANPEVGAEAVAESRDDIKEALKGADMVFITCGEGGGTGTGAAPVIAEIAKQEIGALTVGAVTKPFEFEGKKRMAAAEEGIERLRREVDTLIVLPAEEIVGILKRSSILDAYRLADECLHLAVRSITDLVITTGRASLRRDEIVDVLRDGGRAVFGIGYASGDAAAAEASRRVPASPFSSPDLLSATDFLVNVSSGRELSTAEVNEAAASLAKVNPDATVKPGAGLDSSLDSGVRVSVVAMQRAP